MKTCVRPAILLHFSLMALVTILCVSAAQSFASAQEQAELNLNQIRPEMSKAKFDNLLSDLRSGASSPEDARVLLDTVQISPEQVQILEQFMNAHRGVGVGGDPPDEDDGGGFIVPKLPDAGHGLNSH